MKTILTCLLTVISFSLANAEPAITKETKLIKINDKRIPMKKVYLSLCRSVPREEISPHASAELDLFVNETALNYRKKQPKEVAYPVGSTFVKKKFSGRDSAKADMATIMVKKRNEGKVTDWEFSMVKLPGYTPIDLKGAKHCASCHDNFKDQGYVSKVSENLLRKHLQPK